MVLHRSFLALAVAASTAFAGCSGADSGGSDAGHASAALTANKAHQAKARNSSRRVSESELSSVSLAAYENPEQGVSLLYPRNYALEEGHIVEHSFFLRRQDELDAERPGATLVATILIPEDAYPNTTFEHGSLQLVTEDAWASQACTQAEPVGEGESRRLKKMHIQSASFEGTEHRSSVADATVTERDYIGFQNGTCYEFILVVASGESSAESAKPANTEKVLAQLERIAGSLKVFEKTKVPILKASAEASARL